MSAAISSKVIGPSTSGVRPWARRSGVKTLNCSAKAGRFGPHARASTPAPPGCKSTRGSPSPSWSYHVRIPPTATYSDMLTFRLDRSYYRPGAHAELIATRVAGCVERGAATRSSIAPAQPRQRDRTTWRELPALRGHPTRPCDCSRLSAQERPELGESAVRILLGEEVPARQRPAFDLGCPGAPDAERPAGVLVPGVERA